MFLLNDCYRYSSSNGDDDDDDGDENSPTILMIRHNHAQISQLKFEVGNEMTIMFTFSAATKEAMTTTRSGLTWQHRPYLHQLGLESAMSWTNAMICSKPCEW